jgi:hypothetical protein
MNTLAESVKTACYCDGQIVIQMESGVEIRFQVSENARLRTGTTQELNHIEVSPFGLHWPDLDEDLSFRGLMAGDFGQRQKVSGVVRGN